MANTIYEVSLSANSVPVVSVKSDDQAAIKAEVAWAKEILESLKVPSKSGPGEPKKEEPPVYAIHKVPMVWQKGSKGYFWTCHKKTNGE